MPFECISCKSSDILNDSSRGYVVCTKCGIVLDDSGIIDDDFPSNKLKSLKLKSTKYPHRVKRNDRHLSRSGVLYTANQLKEKIRNRSLINVEEKITFLTTKLSLESTHIDTALKFYKLALSRKLTKSCKRDYLIAACVYLVCRLEETPHMLLDISDAMTIELHELSRTYLKLLSALCIKVTVVDPSLFISRFAHELNFGKMTHVVTKTATRIIHRMKRDWIHIGRRSSGICGAALFVAARMHHFYPSVDEIIRVVKISETTIRKRLLEFCETPSSQLGLEEFMATDLNGEKDPPAYTCGLKMVQQEIDNHERTAQFQQEVTKIRELFDETLQGAKTTPEFSKYFSTDEHTLESLKQVTNEDALEYSRIPQFDSLFSSKESDYGSVSTDFPTVNKYENLRPTAKSIGLKQSIDDCLKIPENSNTFTYENLDIKDLNEEELDNYILSSTESESKYSFWKTCNEDYLKQQKEKEKRNEKCDSKRIRKRRRTSEVDYTEARTAGEAIEKMLQQKKRSFKLNFDLLEALKKKDGVSPDLTTVKSENDYLIDQTAPVKKRKLKLNSTADATLPIRKQISNLMRQSK